MEAWNEKIKARQIWVIPRPRDLYEELLRTTSLTGKPFKKTDGNKFAIHALCLYFAGDRRFEEQGQEFSLQKGIMLQGKPGVGKTHLMNFFAKNPYASYNLPTCKSIADRFMSGWTKDDMSTTDYYSGLLKADIGHAYNQEFLGFCFGDLGAENESKNYGNTRNVMDDIIFNRYEMKIPFKYTHFTTNLDADMIKQVYGERTLDRLCEMCNVLVIEGESFR